jgi:hypothetical protein
MTAAAYRRRRDALRRRVLSAREAPPPRSFCKPLGPPAPIVAISLEVAQGPTQLVVAGPDFVVRVDCAMRLALAQCHPNLASAASAYPLASAPRRTLPAPRAADRGAGREETGRLRWRAGSPPLGGVLAVGKIIRRHGLAASEPLSSKTFDPALHGGLIAARRVHHRCALLAVEGAIDKRTDFAASA